ncbi:extracellular matrix glycoprotein pherophorin-V36 [Volvox carteri f. nagariensis]|uniref:Extracellular matrix glycoprotein pherophorin-V36 n=1 Tax=Volvox carteri f. nagariensis TaxID=3068 RepID=D8TSS2_VOLCA|nr:extracellular matrix glycoprotein pherophorin-V36 [Volvox carteri f. nagariensis]EFJ49422.1 extracellular matrix glycoprotein pherophorin-V36 [Volvox carteri f. nagariensis]|eukprot:XP_002949403.1 extracellular matrix glycoprotein pherophorin-V36 [Volvox carteri f. nagariensis]
MIRNHFLALALVATVIAVADTATINNFPYVSCTKRPGAYSVASTVRMPDPNTFCFTIQATPPTGCTSRCCSADLRKILLDVTPECIVHNPNIRATLNGVATKVGPAFEPGVNGPNGTYALRLTQLGLNITTAAGAEVCISLGLNSQGAGCVTMQQLCKPPVGAAAGTCSIAIFDSQNDCCPISESGTYVAPPPPPPSLPPAVAVSDPCRTCVSLDLVDYGRSVFPGTFPPGLCQQLLDLVSSEVVAADIPLAGLQLTSCTDKLIQACGQFPSDEVGASYQDVLELLMHFWYGTLINTCKAYYRNDYSVTMRIDDGLPYSGCVTGFAFAACDPVSLNWPKCSCNTDRGSTPFYVSPFLNTMPGRTENTTLYCFQLAVREPAYPQGKCGKTTSVLKAEILADDARRRKIRAIGLLPADAVSMRWISTSWATSGEDTLKVTPLNWSKDQADGAKICLELSSDYDIGSFCKTPSNGSCNIILFDDSKDCCPMFEAST